MNSWKPVIGVKEMLSKLPCRLLSPTALSSAVLVCAVVSSNVGVAKAEGKGLSQLQFDNSPNFKVDRSGLSDIRKVVKPSPEAASRKQIKKVRKRVKKAGKKPGVKETTIVRRVRVMNTADLLNQSAREGEIGVESKRVVTTTTSSKGKIPPAKRLKRSDAKSVAKRAPLPVIDVSTAGSANKAAVAEMEDKTVGVIPVLPSAE